MQFAAERDQVHRSASSIQASSKLALATSPCASQSVDLTHMCGQLLVVGASIRPGLRRLRYWCGEPIQGFRFSLPSWGMLQSRTGEAGTRTNPDDPGD
jgi:hypothetical protein